MASVAMNLFSMGPRFVAPPPEPPLRVAAARIASDALAAPAREPFAGDDDAVPAAAPKRPADPKPSSGKTAPRVTFAATDVASAVDVVCGGRASPTKLKLKRKKPRSLSQASGLVFPVARTKRYLKREWKRVGVHAAVYMAATLEYLCVEWLELAGTAARDNKRKRVNARHLVLAARKDDEFNKFLEDAIIVHGGVLPFIHKQLLPPAKTKKRSAPAIECADDSATTMNAA
jgi:histone H2A